MRARRTDEPSHDMPRSWIVFFIAVVASFALLGGLERAKREPVPVPESVAGEKGNRIINGGQIREGMSVWRAIAGRHAGTVLGHGNALGPDWTAEWLSFETRNTLDIRAWEGTGLVYSDLLPERQAAMREHLATELRTAVHDPATRKVAISDTRLRAISDNRDFYMSLFGHDVARAAQREAYGISADIVADASLRRSLSAFFFWTAWAAAVQRPDTAATYTGDWPPYALLRYGPPQPNRAWLLFAVSVLAVGAGLLMRSATAGDEELFSTVRNVASGGSHAARASVPAAPAALEASTLLRAAPPAVWLLRLAGVLFVAYAAMRVICASYATAFEAATDLAHALPYAVAAGWHEQLAGLWMSAAALGAAPLLAARLAEQRKSGSLLAHERHSGAHTAAALARPLQWLAAALMLVAACGALASHWHTTAQPLETPVVQWLVRRSAGTFALGAAWEALLVAAVVACALGALLVARTRLGRLAQSPAASGAAMVVAAALAAALYASGPTWADPASAATMEYWRSSVVHLWSEGFFQLLAAAAVAAASVADGLVAPALARRPVVFSAMTYVVGGAVALWCVHFSGAPAPICALGAALSALQGFALLVVALQAWRAAGRASDAGREGVATWRWPYAFFAAGSVWNLVRLAVAVAPGAWPPAVYYMHGLLAAPLHVYVTLPAVYGMLAAGALVWGLDCAGLRPHGRALGAAFWTLNVGIAVVLFAGVLPAGVAQLRASLEQGLWYARSAGFLAGEPLATWRTLRWAGELVVAVGTVTLAASAFSRRPRAQAVRVGASVEN